MFTEAQASSLLRLLYHCRQKVPFYRRLLKDWSGTDITYEEFQRLPLIDKAALRQHNSDFLTEGTDLAATVNEVTSGSTGIPLLIPRTRTDRMRASLPLVKRRTSWLGKLPDVNSFAGFAAFASEDDVAYIRNGWLLLSMRDMTPQMLDVQVNRLLDYKPQMLQGPAQALVRLASWILERGVDMSPAKIALVESRSEFLFEGQRRQIERAFKCPAANVYGSHECWGIGYDCSEHQLHVMEDSAIVEVLDERGNPVAPGQEGEVVVTGLNSYTLPIVRYRLGDRVRLGESPCPCGSSAAYVELTGFRTSQWIVTPTGRTQPSVLYRLWQRFGKDPAYSGVLQFQLIQRAIDRFQFNVAIEGGCPQDLESGVSELLQAALGYPIALQVSINGDFTANQRSGKLSWFLCECDRP